MFLFRKPKLEVFLRTCAFSEVSQHKKRPSYFSHKACFENLTSTLEDASLTIFFDSKAGPLPYIQESKFPVIEISEGTEAGSFLRMLAHVLRKKSHPDTIYYFVEDDYLHKPGWTRILKEAFTLPIDYATLYDHRDKYFFKDYENLTSKIFHTDSCHFRTTPSTTNTYAMRAKTLKRDFLIHKKYSENRKISADHEKFCALAQEGAILVSAIPGYATHMEEKFLSPVIDWSHQFHHPLI